MVNFSFESVAAAVRLFVPMARLIFGEDAGSVTRGTEKGRENLLWWFRLEG